MDYEKFKQDMEQDVLKNLANRGIEAETEVQPEDILAAVLRLADEIDVGVDRNPELLFDTSALTKQVDIDAFGLHESIRMVEVTENATALMIPGLFVLPEPVF